MRRERETEGKQQSNESLRELEPRSYGVRRSALSSRLTLSDVTPEPVPIAAAARVASPPRLKLGCPLPLIAPGQSAIATDARHAGPLQLLASCDTAMGRTVGVVWEGSPCYTRDTEARQSGCVHTRARASSGALLYSTCHALPTELHLTL